MTDFPPLETLDNVASVALLIETRGSEIEKTLCGKRLLAWVDTLRESRK